MSSDRDQFLKAVRTLGFVPIGRDGNGHIRVRHELTGDRYSVTWSPSDHRARRNEIAELEQLSGRRLPRQRSGHYQHRRVPVTDLRKTPAELSAAAEIDELVAEAEELRLQFAALPHTRGAINEARELVQRFEAIRDQLAERYRHIPSLDSVTY